MESRPRASLKSFLDQAGRFGRLDSEGVFTISQQEALRKLAEFQLPRAQAWVLKIAQAAVSSGSPGLEFRQSRKATTFSFSPTKSIDLEALFRAILSHSDSASKAIEHLAVGLRAVGFGGGRAFSLILTEGTQQTLLGWDGSRLGEGINSIGLRAGPGVGVCLGVAHPEVVEARAASQKKALAAELEELVAGVEASPIPVLVNGKRVDSLGAPLVDTGQGLGRRVILNLGWRPFSPDSGLPELLLPAGIRCHKPSLRLTDRFTDDRVLRVDGDPDQRQISSISKLSYGYHIDSHRSSLGRFRFHNKPRHSYVHWLLDGVVCERHRWQFEPTAVAFDLYLSAAGLPTDASSLKIVRRPDVAHRISRALPWVGQQAESTARSLSRRVPRPFGHHTAIAGLFGLLAVTNPAVALFQLMAGGVAATHLALSLYDKHQLMNDAAVHLRRVAQHLNKKA